MNPFELDLPTTDDQMGFWLERQLVSGDLIDTVEKLHTLSGATEAKRILRDESLDRRLNEAIDGLGQMVIDTGASVLSNAQIARLFREPELLFALQDLVLTACSPYWDNLLATQPITKLQPIVDSTNRNIAPPNVVPPPISLISPSDIGAERFSVNDDLTTRLGSAAQRTWYLPAAVSSLCTAAAVLIAFGIWQSRFTPLQVAQSACRWSIPVLLKSTDGRQLFRQVADDATWPTLPHSTAADLAKEIADYRAKCSQLILTDFAFLRPEEQTFLRDKCRLWAKKMDEQLVRIESQSNDDPTLRLQVHTDMAIIITNLQKALRAA